MNTTAKPTWITWETQLRNRSLSKKFDARLFELNDSGNRLIRYCRLSYKTIKIILDSEGIIFVQNPSIVLALLSCITCRIIRKPCIVDAHNGGLFPLEGRYRMLNYFAQLTIRLAHHTIVSNSGLCHFVSEHGGKPLVLPDPLPNFEHCNAPQKQNSVVFICTWALDEPFKQVLAAAEALPKDITLYVTGKPPAGILAKKDELPPNVFLTGFLDESNFYNLLSTATVIMDLTDREDCLVCGAYEAVALEKPMILSDSQALKSYFNRGALFTQHSPSALSENIVQSLKEQAELRKEVKSLKEDLIQNWESQFELIRVHLGFSYEKHRG